MARGLKDKKEYSFNSRKVVKYLGKFLVTFSYVIIAVVFMSNLAFADVGNDGVYSDLFSEAESIFDYVTSKFFELSTGAVIIAVAIGVFFRKFSMGKQEQIEKGNKLIRDSLIGYLMLNSMPVIARTIKGFTAGTIVK